MKKPPFKQHIADLAHLLKRYGVRHVVICPGSRNAPLIQVFQRDPEFSCHSIVDERSASYLALGIARQTGEPVAIVTTSGTAALNLAPAVAEAFCLQLPLVVLTADRPPEWPPQFSNQRINQLEIFRPNAKGFLNQEVEPIGGAVKAHGTKGIKNSLVNQVPGDNSRPEKMLEEVSALISSGLASPRGPVHINLVLHEPLYETISDASETSRSMTIPKSPTKTTNSTQDEAPLSETESRLISTDLADQKKVLLIAGMGSYSTEEQQLLCSLTAQYQAAVIAENITNLNGSAAGSGTIGDNIAGGFSSVPELVIASADEKELKALQPELVIIFGEQVVSKKMRLFVQGLINVPVIATKRLPIGLFHRILSETKSQNPDTSTATKWNSLNNSSTNPYLSAWKQQETTALHRAADFFTSAPFSNLTAINAILARVPPTTTLHLGNSGTIRYSQLSATRNDLAYYSNRGTSGIDGSLSAAVGAAMVSPGPHLAILGDLSFVYDSNALWNKNFPKNLKIIVLNDQGGGIFRLLDGPSRMPFFGEFSVTNHPVDLQHLAGAFGLKHLFVSDIIGLKTALATLFSGDTGPALLEVNTTKSENSAIFKQFFKALKNE